MKINAVQSVLQGMALMMTMGWDRVIVTLAALISVTVLTLAGKLDTTVFVAVIGPIIGYIVGAGHESLKVNGREH